MNYKLLTRSYHRINSSILKWSSNTVRNEFLNYFKKDLGHTFIRSSPVTPLNDYTVAFVNAGMNQFKGIFLGQYDPPAKEVTNSQKCIRISGKHNDLNVVGNDTFHHTFFEMLGNWSFGSYFKEEACRYAWNLLTKRYNIAEELLYVTYFGGDEKLGLEPDLECREIWLQIGVPESKLLPFGIQENFWEMGVTGPCGPCTEIHVDQSARFTNRIKDINKGYDDLTELWNIVFIQYERKTDGSIVSLPKHHVDTGVGFERLVSLLQGKKSNYDTDLFQPLLRAIQKYTKAPEYKGEFSTANNHLDYGYRVLADHSRMISVALADGAVPELSNKLRKTMRRAIDIGESLFKMQGILPELSYTVAESLGETYPELRSNLSKVQRIIQFEEDLYKKLQSSSGKQWRKVVQTRPALKSVTEWTTPGLVSAYTYLQQTIHELKAMGVLPGKIAFKLYDTYGLSIKTIAELANLESLRFDESAFQKELANHRNRSRIGFEKDSDMSLKKFLDFMEKENVPKTDDGLKYQYRFNETTFEFPEISCKIVSLILDGNVVTSKPDIISCIRKAKQKRDIGFILNKTICYAMEGGQVSDRGFISVGSFKFKFTRVRKMNGYIIHYASLDQDDSKEWSDNESIEDSCVVSIDPEFRVGSMQHHTAAHLINAALKKILQAFYPRNSLILSNQLKLQFNSFGEKPTLTQLKEVEDLVNDVVRFDRPVDTKVLNMTQLLAEDSVTLIPGEVYPYNGIRVVVIDHRSLKSKEACCGTHVPNTGILKHFCLLDYYSKGALNFNIKAAVGSTAISAKLAGERLWEKILQLEEKLNFGETTWEEFKAISKDIQSEIKKDSEMAIPYLVKKECLAKLESLNEVFCWRRQKMQK